MITGLDGLVTAMADGSTRQKVQISKSASTASQVVGGQTSLWRVAGLPAQGAIPTAAANCTASTVGGVILTSGLPGVRYLAQLAISSTTTGQSYEIHDRLAHMGGLNGTLTTTQTVGIDLSSGTNNLTERVSASDYSTVQWWLEWYTATGNAAVTATVTYTNQFGVSGRTVAVSVPASTAAGRMIQIIPTIVGDNIRSIQSVTLSATTNTAGNFGVTATRQRAEMATFVANMMNIMDWAQLGLPIIYEESCLFFLSTAVATTVPPPNGALLVVRG